MSTQYTRLLQFSRQFGKFYAYQFAPFLERTFPGLNSGVFIAISLLVAIALSAMAHGISARILKPLYTKQQMLQR